MCIITFYNYIIYKYIYSNQFILNLDNLNIFYEKFKNRNYML